MWPLLQLLIDCNDLLLTNQAETRGVHVGDELVCINGGKKCPPDRPKSKRRQTLLCFSFLEPVSTNRGSPRCGTFAAERYQGLVRNHDHSKGPLSISFCRYSTSLELDHPIPPLTLAAIEAEERHLFLEDALEAALLNLIIDDHNFTLDQQLGRLVDLRMVFGVFQRAESFERSKARVLSSARLGAREKEEEEQPGTATAAAAEDMVGEAHSVTVASAARFLDAALRVVADPLKAKAANDAERRVHIGASKMELTFQRGPIGIDFLAHEDECSICVQRVSGQVKKKKITPQEKVATTLLAHV